MLSDGGGNINDLYKGTLTFLYIAMVAVTFAVVNSFLPVIMYSVGGQQ
jgi:peptide/bleomycin uptake transporter